MDMDINDIFSIYKPDKRCNKPSSGCFGRGYYTEIVKGEPIRNVCRCVVKQMVRAGIDLEKLTVTNRNRHVSMLHNQMTSIDDLLKTGSKYK
jgi:hypothetical protein